MIIALFDKDNWSKKKIEDFFRDHGYEVYSSQLRTGFSHLILVESKEIDFSTLKTVHPILVLNFNSSDETILKLGHRYTSEGVTEIDVEELLNKDNKNYAFDIKNFGYKITGNSDFQLTIQNIQKGLPGNLSDLSKVFTCEDLLNSNAIEPKVKKLLVDIYGLLTANVLTQVTFSNTLDKDDSVNYVKFYSAVTCATFLTRAQIEKIIQLISMIDPDLNYDALQGSKSLKRAFYRQAEGSKLDITKELAHSLSNIEILDDNFRTPEAHKLSRILGLLNNLKRDTYTTLINEVISNFNWSNQTYKKVCDYLRTQTPANST